ncbi:hypothetical protein [Nannocystis pusilla]|uniref:Lipoprotein n=1 Tax=Nannocystis pusilla TaxID=889268 RepID=A0ABS7TNJ8_9BACT|nr:hypothetical protein [Nannocystis pusilla]MBZ5709808.1 hypothetical protein [Nannocystis pusilla]
MKKTIAIVFAALSVATFGCNKGKTDTANPEEAKTDAPAETPAEGEGEGDKTAEETPAEGTPAEGGDAPSA